ncbi:hypothetical protein [Oceanicoccus sp. KOV_DT_Chl]|uniref:hypothetical protein n=1 Tax=Oceanicoccus sp. KOV_DT_Chl TaxID=1904639 RepID=UPI00135CA494|nr:hypothetical protein [Oceanicoccus sp. KOV_DT_Chl]
MSRILLVSFFYVICGYAFAVDTDSDGFSDELEVSLGYSPVSSLDSPLRNISNADLESRDFFGASVAVDGTTVVVAANGDNSGGINAGAIYVYELIFGELVKQAELFVYDMGDARFGDAIAIDGDTIVVGVPNKDDGSAFVFVRENDDWKQQAKLISSDGVDNDFGASVTISGDLIVIGADRDSIGGAVYIFNREGEEWTESAKLHAGDPYHAAKFGHSVAVGESILFVGTSTSSTLYSAVYIFAEHDGEWIQSHKLAPSDTQYSDYFGKSLAYDNGTLVVGSYRDDHPSSNSGSVYIFTEGASNNWIQRAKMGSTETSIELGASVAIDGDRIVAGATGGAITPRSITVYVRNGNTWVQQLQLSPVDGDSLDDFGQSVAISNNIVVVGAPFKNAPLEDAAGGAYFLNIDHDDDGLLDHVETNTGMYLNFNDHGTSPIKPDTDDDGLLDGFEASFGFDPLQSGEENLDGDVDTLSNLQEQTLGTSPLAADSDSDGLADNVELSIGTDPLNDDSDYDGLLDGQETNDGLYSNSNATGTNPLLADTDNDGLADGVETHTGTFISKENTGTNPHVNDSDSDGLLDGFEVLAGFDPLAAGEELLDADGDGLNNYQEQGLGTSPMLTDSDMDGVSDDSELSLGTNPIDPDTDNDGLSDGVETATGVYVDQGNTGSDPLLQDTDGDGLLDGFETQHGFDPLVSGLVDMDTDGDKLSDLQEQALGTNPNANDTDGDGFNDNVEVAIATDPLNILSAPLDKIRPGDGVSNTGFGSKMAADENTLVIGVAEDDDAAYNGGAVYIFRRDQQGKWIESQKLTASDADRDDEFGYSVSIDGSTLVVGAREGEVDGLAVGVAYVFTEVDGVWSEQQKLFAPDGEEWDFFGYSVAIDDDRIVVGAYGADDRYASAGAVYVFARDGNSWSMQTKLLASDAEYSGNFGQVVAIHNSTIVVGAASTNYNDYEGATPAQVYNGAGAVYIFAQQHGHWKQQAKLIAYDARSDDGFGSSLAIENNVLAVGVPAKYKEDDYTRRGAVYIYSRNAGSWQYIQKLEASDALPGDSFGKSVSLQGRNLAVGASQQGENNVGAVYLFTLNDGSWTELHKLPAFDQSSYDYFGGNVAITNGVLAVSASGDDDAGNSAGSMYVFYLDADNDGLLDIVETNTGDYISGDDSGTNPLVEDMDSDGLLDGFELNYGFNPLFAVEAELDPDSDGLTNIEEQLNGTNPLLADSDGDGLDDVTEINIGTEAQNFDTDDDGLSDGEEVVAGTNPLLKDTDDDGLFDGFEISNGLNPFYVGDAQLDNDQDSLNNLEEQARKSNPHLPDTDFDGLPDNVETKTWNYIASNNQGTDPQNRDTDFDGFTDGLEVQAGTSPLDDADNPFQKLLPEPGEAYDYYSRVALDGDTMLVGAHGDDAGSKAGAIYAYRLVDGKWSLEDKFFANDAVTAGGFGSVLAVSGATAVIGHSGDGTIASGAGAAYVFVRNGSIWVQQAKLFASDAQGSDRFGASVAIKGDTILIGAYLEDEAAYNGGAAYVFTRTGTIWTEQAKLMASDYSREGEFGSSVALNDGIALIGAPKRAIRSGAAYVFVRQGNEWSEQAILIPDDIHSSSYIGQQLAIDYNTALIAGSGSRYVYVFQRVGGAWTQQASLLPSDYQVSDQFGSRLGVSGNTAFIKSSDCTVYIFTESSNSWHEQQRINPGDGDEIKCAYMSVDSNRLAIGSWQESDLGIDSGAAYVVDIDWDNDGLIDFAESNTGEYIDPSNTGSSPWVTDSDEDGLLDGFEVAYGFNPLQAGEEDLDSDNDGLSNYQEQNLNLVPISDDSDGDGLFDGFELDNNFNPLQGVERNNDPDLDGLTNFQEQTYGTDPWQLDTDGDSFSDGEEIASGHNPLKVEDCDIDSLFGPSVGDLLILSRQLLELIQIESLECDINHDGKASVTDMLLLEQLLLQ